ncbi:class I SAM-dependent RNA methyltransferase [Mariprofundus ferrooxydans]|uniref:class I SAM-dependent RNA methyltransferase n=1 Tax=Mariprofundus ferrooxydans TaxID=314344 RepID=UPI00035F4DBE|nr:methyltransferase [Mariprofundus ferrooxydans]
MITGIAESILPGGETLVRTEGHTMLVANAVPGDELSVRPLQKRRGVLRGEIATVNKPGPQRVSAECPVAGECGGCALQFLAPQSHAALKSAWVHDAFRALIGVQTQWVEAETVAAASRRRVHWMVNRDEQGSFAGFYAHASHRVIRHEQCMVLTPGLQRLHSELLQRPALLSGVQGIQALELADGMHVVLEGAITEASDLPLMCADLPVQWWRRQDDVTRPLNRPVQRFHDRLPAGEQDILLAVGPDDFVQGQEAGNRKLIALIQQWAGPVRRIADLFCGIGNLSLPLAVASGAELFGAELNPASVRAAQTNAKRLGVKASFVQANLFEDFNMEPYIGADLLILDPPRRGAKRICSRITHLMPKQIIMISCDPAAGARDGVMLQQQGYQLKALQALDLFAYAGHVESLSLWERA